MKRFIIISIVLTVIYGMNAQTFVSTVPANKNVILEEFTGVTCVNCPDGHRIANEIIASHPHRVFSINIHQGGFALPSGSLPDFRTEFGDALAQQSQISGYPAGTVNRRIFPAYSNTEELMRSNWAAATDIVFAEPSCVNIAAQSTIDFNTRQLVVNVEVYYTSNSAVSTNSINVALLQSNVLAPQSGMASNPAQIVGELYRHNHILRHLLTEQWGDEVNTTTAGTFISRQYTYSIPENIREVPCVLEDLDVVVFIAEGHKNIITAAESSITYLNVNPRLGKLTELDTDECSAKTAVEVKNFWNAQEIREMDFVITDNTGSTTNFHWNGRIIGQSANDTIILPEIELTPDVENNISIAVTAINGQKFSCNADYTLAKRKFNVHSNVKIKLATDRYASQVTCELISPTGEVALTAGPWSDLSYNGIMSRNIDLPLTQKGCWVFRIYDSGGDGVNSGFGNGYIDVLDEAGKQIHRFDGKFTDTFGVFLNSDGMAGNENIISENEIEIYPNPASDELRIKNYELRKGENIEITNVLGKLVVSSTSTTINISHLQSGMYLLKAGNQITKFIKR
ncbi:MAG: Omp28-related outer membrane protein [Dysgonamonadaceae bacterium]|nr:Omp28-related outer membrane protein [Dysgonamonadaceae bacterium]